MSGKKYAIHPGYVYSKFDGGEHYVGYQDLVRLYRVKRNECIEWDESHAMGRKHDDYIHLFPQSDGNYRLPTEKPQMTERELLRKAAKTDPVTRGAYADWLDEHDEPLLASVYRMSAESLSELKGVIVSAVTETVPDDSYSDWESSTDIIRRHYYLTRADPYAARSQGAYDSNSNWMSTAHNSYEYAERVRELHRLRELSQYQPQPNDDHEEAGE